MKKLIAFFMIITCMPRASAESDATSASNNINALNGYFLAAGGCLNFTKDDASAAATNYSHNLGIVGVTLAVGGGKLLKTYPLYLGGEIYTDIASSPEKKINVSGNEGSLRRKGFSFGAGLRAGVAINSISSIAFAKCGFEQAKSSLNTQDIYYSSSKISPTLGVGFESVVTNKMSIRIDANYRFKASDTQIGTAANGTIKATPTIKLKQCGSFSIRALAAYNVHI